jgi:hypothetical protein
VKTRTVRETKKQPTRKVASKAASKAALPDLEETVDEKLNRAIRAKLVSIAMKSVTPRSLLELEKMTRLMREFIAVELDPVAPKISQFTQSSMADNYAPLAGDLVGGSNVLATSPPAENFGATIVRELMSLWGSKKTEVPHQAPSDTDRLIDSIALAREKGLLDVEKKLMKQLVKMTAVPFESKPFPFESKPFPSEPPKKPHAMNESS